MKHCRERSTNIWPINRIVGYLLHMGDPRADSLPRHNDAYDILIFLHERDEIVEGIWWRTYLIRDARDIKKVAMRNDGLDVGWLSKKQFALQWRSISAWTSTRNLRRIKINWSQEEFGMGKITNTLKNYSNVHSKKCCWDYHKKYE